jgi:hypothetical protein
MLILAAVEQNIQQQVQQPQHQEMWHQNDNNDMEDSADPNDIYNIIQQMAGANDEDDLIKWRIQ